MRRLNLLGTSALRSAVFVGATLSFAASAIAQEVAEEKDPSVTLQSEQEVESGEDATTGEEILVTGSRIRRPNLESSVPVTSLGGEEFFQTGQTSVGDVLNELPALRSTFGQANSTRFLGTSGLNILDLRGLGTQRTLVLQNGRRHVGADILNAGVSVDTNQTDLIERVDVVTGGSSAIYGSDAIAGVVNFVLKRDFEGAQLRAQGGISEHGDAGQYYVSGLWGTNFGDGRGNIAINAEYARQNDWYASQRKAYRTTNAFVTVDTDPAGALNGSDGIPDTEFFFDTRSNIYSNGGIFSGCCDPSGNYYQAYRFQPDGTLRPQVYGDLVGTGSFGTAIGGDGDNFRDGKQFGFSPKLDRYSVNLVSHFTVSEAFEPFVEAKYVRTESLGNASGPFFFNGGITGDARERPRTDNPFLNPQARAFLQDYYGTAAPVRFYMQRNVVELGNREEEAKRETYRIVGGVRGDFNDDWSYEVAANYGEFNEKTKILGNVNLQRFLLAFDAAVDPASGQIRCRSQFAPVGSSARNGFGGASDTDYANAQLAQDIAQCAPINLFGEGNISQAARDYVLQDTVADGKITQFVANAFLSGDSSEWFELPGGPVGFAVGAEYRRETNFYDQEEVVDAGLTFYNSIPTFDPPSFEVKEAFAEIRLPILTNQDFFEALTLNAAGRVADYKGSTGTVFAYNVGLEWSPVQDLRFRGQYARSVRAPNLGELYTPFGQNYAPPPADPCALDNIGTGSATREANCRAAGIPATFNYEFLSSLPFLSGGNEDLKEESSDSYTFGGVVQPRFLPGFSFSADYYDITVKDVISGLSAQGILNQCYDEATLDNPYCDLFERYGAAGGPGGEDPFSIIPNSLQVTPLNFAKLQVRGIDAEVAYRRTIEGLGALSTRLTYTHVLQNDSFLNPADPERANSAKRELGDPRDAFNWNVELKRDKLTLGYQMRYIGKMAPGAIENIRSIQDRDPENADAFPIDYYSDVLYHDIRVGYDVNEKFNFYMGVDNVGDRLPPYSLTGAGAGSGIYNNIGRFFYAGAVAKF